MITKEQAAVLERSIVGVRFDDLDGAEQDVMLFLMNGGYCAADCRRDPDALFITQAGYAAIEEYKRSLAEALSKKRSLWRDLLLAAVSAVIGAAVSAVVTVLLTRVL